MVSELNVEAILHLNALSLIIAIAYLGLDRVHLEKDTFLEALELARKSAINFVMRYDVTPGQTPVAESMFYRFPFSVRLKFFVICQIGDVHRDINMGASWRTAHWWHRQRHAPLLGYFYKRHDRAWVSIFAAILLVLFLYATAAALWDLKYFPADFWWPLHWVEAQNMMTPTYWVCIVVLLWIFFTVGITHLLQRIEAIGDRLQRSIDDHMKAIAGDVTRNSLNRAEEKKSP